MMPTSITVIVEQPIDWVGSVLVPCAAILISTGIAVWLAASERREARRERRESAMTNLTLALTEVNSIGPDRARRSEQNRRLTAFVSAANATEPLITKAEYPVLALVVAMVLREAKRGRSRLSRAASAALLLLSEWRSGDIEMEEIERRYAAMSDWDRGFVADNWREHLELSR